MFRLFGFTLWIMACSFCFSFHVMSSFGSTLCMYYMELGYRVSPEPLLMST